MSMLNYERLLLIINFKYLRSVVMKVILKMDQPMMEVM